MKRRNEGRELQRLSKILRQIQTHPGSRRVALGLLGRSIGLRWGEPAEGPSLN